VKKVAVISLVQAVVLGTVGNLDTARTAENGVAGNSHHTRMKVI
jgi:hypothetical protein